MHALSTIEELKDYVASCEGGVAHWGSLAFGVPEIDRYLPANGLAKGALHEIIGSPQLADDAAATIFIAGIMARLEGTVIWCLRWRDLFAPSLHLTGLDANRVIFVEASDDKGVLTAMEEALRHEGLAAVIGELKKLSTTSSKRLQLAAEKSGVPAFVFRRWIKPGEQITGSAATTRWSITSAPSEAVDYAGLARPRWNVSLERVRGAEPKSWIVEAADAQGRIALPSELADRPASAGERQAAA